MEEPTELSLFKIEQFYCNKKLSVASFLHAGYNLNYKTNNYINYMAKSH